MKTIAIANLSGGRGRTAVTKRLADELMTRHHKRVLIIDLDPLTGSNVSTQFLPFDQARLSTQTILEALVDPHTLPHTIHAQLSLFTGDETLRQAEMNNDTALRTFLQNRELSQLYDYCLIDCNAVLNSLTRNALVAADCVLVPIWIRRSSTDFDMAESNVSYTFEVVRRLKGEQSLPTEDVGFSISKPLNELSDEDWGILTRHIITY